MKKFMKAFPFALGAALCLLPAVANAQTVQLSGLGSSALFLEAGLGANNPSGPVNAACVWSGNNNPNANPSNVVAATDTSSPAGSLSDAGNAWVAWTPGSGTCDAPGTNASVYAYLQTDSVVGDRCLFNANLSPSKCSIMYPVVTDPVNHPIIPAGLILGTANEHNLPASISNALNAFGVNYAGTDIRPEDAWFATRRALTSCATPVASSQYLGLGYNNGEDIVSSFGGTSASVFHAIDFNLPSAPGVGYTVTPVGATPIVVVVNGQSTTSGFGAGGFTNITSDTLAKFLDGHLSLTSQVNNQSATTGNGVTVLIREPLSGTYNTLEYNVPNTTVEKTSQDVGFNQDPSQQNCNGANVGSTTLNIATANGHRRRAIGTGQELSEVYDAANGDVIGYGFWSVANFAGFDPTVHNTAANARYLQVDGVDPLGSSSFNGVIPLNNTQNLANVTLNTINNLNPNYPIWSLLRFVNVGTSAPTVLTNLSAATQSFVSHGVATSRPDFITAGTATTNGALALVRSHFVPPLPTNQPTPAANGHVSLASSNCTNPEVGGDVGGVVLSLTADSSTCRSQATGAKVGTTGDRR